jgi:hypothetical protein
LHLDAEDELDAAPYEAPIEAVRVVSRLREQPPGPYRSLGKYLDYSNWPDRERFLELDQDIRRRALEMREHGSSHADPEELQLPDEIQRVA